MPLTGTDTNDLHQGQRLIILKMMTNMNIRKQIHKYYVDIDSPVLIHINHNHVAERKQIIYHQVITFRVYGYCSCFQTC